MSEHMARKKKEDIAALEQEEEKAWKEIQGDRCPVCGLPTVKVEFFNQNIIKVFGWIECSRCGAVYTPKSIMKQKKLMASSGLSSGLQSNEEPPSLIVPA